MDLGTVVYHKLVVTKVWLPWLQWLSGLFGYQRLERKLLDYLTTIISTTEHLVYEGRSPDSISEVTKKVF